MITAFGKRARRWAAGTESDGKVIAADETAYLDAVVEAVKRRMRGEHFGVALLLDEDPNRFVKAWAAQLLSSAKDIDQRRGACMSIAMGTVVIDGKRQMELGGVSGDTLNLGRLLWNLGERGVVISENTYSRLAMIFGRWHAVRETPRQGDAEVPIPAGEPGDREHVVIWAGSRSADEIAVIACALEELHIPVYAVCAGGMLPSTIHRCTMAQAEPLLRTAAAVVDTTDDRPGAALALAAFGVPMAVARTSGAQEFLDGAHGYDGWNRDSILDAVLQALGSRHPQRRERSERSRRPEEVPAVVRDRAPLVSIVIPTRDRRPYLPLALESIAKQDYPAVETVVVNDAEPVRDITERFGAILVQSETPIDHAAAWNAGIERARGEYVAFVDDDDMIFPDHVSSLVECATFAKAPAVHASTLIAHRGPSPQEFVGFSPGSLAGVDLEEALVNCPLIGMIGGMVRRDIFSELGGFDSGVAPNDDYEMILRIALQYDWVHADRVTYLYTREGGYEHASGRTTPFADLYERSYKRHPFPDRPLLAARRRQFIEQLRVNGIQLNTVSSRLARPTTLVGGRSRASTSPPGRRTLKPKAK